METRMHKIGLSCAISIPLERFQNGIFSISGNSSDEKNVKFPYLSVFFKQDLYEKEGVQ